MRRRIISILLTVTFLVELLSFPVRAEGVQTEINNSDVTIEGSNGFGTLLSSEITENQERNAEESTKYDTGYTVTDLVIEGNTATVTYNSLENSTLVVAIYDEDGLQMLTSGTVEVTPDATEAVVTIEGDMPEYFMASAYLLDNYDMSPLCVAYDTPMYTQEMQELLASTVADYDADKVLNLDEDDSTNFAVFADEIIMIKEQEGINTIMSVDDETFTYVIGNADESITSLTEGDIFAYPYGENEILIVKVASITVNGTTATIYGADLELEEVFSHMKLENQAGLDKAIVDDRNLESGIVYEGMVQDDLPQTFASRAVDGSGTLNVAKLSYKFKAFEEMGVELNGSFTFKAAVKLKYYISKNYSRFELVVSPEISAEVELKSKLSTDDDPLLKKLEILLCPIKLPFLWGAVTVEFTPSFVAEFSVSVTVELAKFKADFGFYFDTGKNGSNFRPIYSGSCEFFEVDAEGELFVGVSLKPSVGILGKVAEAAIKGKAGATISAKPTIRELDETADVIHACDGCCDGDISLTVSTKASLELFGKSYLDNDISFFDISWKFADFYFCYEHEEFSLGVCPYQKYRTIVLVTDAEGTPIPNATVTIGGNVKQTDDNGLAVFYLLYLVYEVTAERDGVSVTKTIMANESQKVVIRLDDNGERENILGTVAPEEITDNGAIVASGTCGAEGDNVKWVLYGSGLLEISGSGEMANFGSAATPWYSARDKITAVVIKDDVTNIGAFAFYGCSSLSSIQIPNSVTRIGDRTFSSCSSLSSIEIPNSVTSIGCGTFEYCSSLTSIEIPNSVTSMGAQAFFCCSSLKSIQIPNSVTSIETQTFWGCSSLKSIEIPNSVTSIEDRTFYNCSSLSSIEIPDSVTSIGDRTFYNCSSLSSIEIPDSVTSIGDRVFCGCSSLTSIEIPNSVMSVGDYAFSDCSDLMSIQIPNSVTSIGANVFYNCSSLASVEIPKSVTSIGAGAFHNCSNLTSIEIPNSVTSIGNSTFYNCSSLTSIEIPNSVTSIGDSTFYNCFSLTGIQIPNSVTSIGWGAFYKCRSLASIEIPNSVTSIGDRAFEYCSSLTSIEIPNSVTSIGNRAFSGCSSLTSIEIPNNITSIGDYAFSGCSGLTSIEIPNSVTSIGGYAFSGCSGLMSIQVSDSLTSIGEYAFSGCSGLTSIEIPNSVTSIGASAFSRCYDLKSIEIPNGVTNIGDRTFYNCSSLSSIEIPGSVTSIGASAFYDCASLTSVEIPNSVTSIGDYVFSECSGLTSIQISDSVTSIGDYAFSKCSGLTSMEIPNSVTSIGEYTFSGCSGLTSIEIPNSVTSIGASAFSKCYDLTSIEIPNSVTNIGVRAFDECSSLASVDIPNNVTNIENYAFRCCSSLKTIKFYGDMFDAGQYLFAEVTAIAYYPADNATWSDLSWLENNAGGYLTWVPYTLDENGDMIIEDSALLVTAAVENRSVDEDPEVIPDFISEETEEYAYSSYSIYPGEYETEITDTHTLKTASFTDLVANEQYVLLVLKEVDVEEPLSADNLLYIDQAEAADDGTLVFQYVQCEDTTISYVVACGASNKNLSDAEITFPEMTASEGVQAVNPSVVYDGQILVEGRDYIVLGTVDFTQAGEYVCYIRGIYNYTGVVECSYMVTEETAEEPEYLPGDINNDGMVNNRDLTRLFQYLSYWEVEVNEAALDVNGDGSVNNRDLTRLFQYLSNWDVEIY